MAPVVGTPALNVTLNEGSPPGTVVGTPAYTDHQNEPPTNFTFSILSPDPSNGLFAFASSGALVVSPLALTSPLNYYGEWPAAPLALRALHYVLIDRCLIGVRVLRRSVRVVSSPFPCSDTRMHSHVPFFVPRILLQHILTHTSSLVLTHPHPHTHTHTHSPALARTQPRAHTTAQRRRTTRWPSS